MVTEQIVDREKINKIIVEKIKDREKIFTKKYWISISKRNISHEKVLEIFPQFEKIEVIEKDILKFGDEGYELFYRMSNNLFFSIATCPNEKKIYIIHAVEYKRSLEKRFQNIKLK